MAMRLSWQLSANLYSASSETELVAKTEKKRECRNIFIVRISPTSKGGIRTNGYI